MVLLAMAAAWAGETTTEDGQVVHWTEAEVMVRASVKPDDFPEAANALPSDRLNCTLRIYIDPKGVPMRTEPRTCDPVLYPAAHRVAMRYRFFPEGGRHLVFDLSINYHTQGRQPTDIRTVEAETLAADDTAGGYVPVDPAILTVKREAPDRLRVVPAGAKAHTTADRVCRLRVRVGANGAVKDTATVRCAADLRADATKLVEAWRFQPAEIDGARAAVSFDALVNYDGAAPLVTFVVAEGAAAE